MGLPGSGKTTLAEILSEKFDDCMWLNADKVRKQFNDWDFSIEGRIRQAERMKNLADNTECSLVICDFVAPLKRMRDIFDADFTIWLNTIESGRFEDTNALFEPPTDCDFIFNSCPTEKDIEALLPQIEERL